MSGTNPLEILFILSAFLFQIILIVHFALRKWQFHIAMRFGLLVYALSLPGAAVSLWLHLGGISWTFWVSGFLYLIWAIYGYIIEYRLKIEWRNPFNRSVGGLYLFLYLATVMFYWWPLALIHKTLWYYFGILFIASTVLNLTSHKKPEAHSLSS